MVKLRRHSTLLGRVPRVNSDEFCGVCVKARLDTPHDAYSAYPASEVILHALGIYMLIFGIPLKVSPLPSPPIHVPMPPKNAQQCDEKEKCSINRGIGIEK